MDVTQPQECKGPPPSGGDARMTTSGPSDEGGYVLATVEPSSAVYHSVYARFLAPNRHNVVIAYPLVGSHPLLT